MNPNSPDQDSDEPLYKERLRKAEARFRIVCDAMPAGLIVLSLDGVIDFINRKTEKIFQFDSNAMIGEGLSFLIDEPLLEPFSLFADRVKAHGQVELKARKGNGESLVIELSLRDFEIGRQTVFLSHCNGYH